MGLCRQIITMLLACIAMGALAQAPGRETFLTAGLNISSIGWSPSHLSGKGPPHFSRTGNFGVGLLSNNSGKKRLSIIANTGIGLHAGFMWKDRRRNNLNGIQLEFQSNKACYSFNYPFRYGFRGDTVGRWVEADNYLKCSVSLMRTWYLFSRYKNDNDFWYTKLSFGQTFHHTSFGSRYATNQEEDWTENGTGMRSRVVSFQDLSLMISPEIGHKFLLANDNILDIGLVYHQPLQNTRTMEYEFFKQGVPLGKSQITFSGATVMLNLSYTLVHKLKRKQKDSSSTEEPWLATTGGEEEEPAAGTTGHAKKVNGRRYKIQQSFTVHAASLVLTVWDRNRIDGDEISLYLNGEPVLEEYMVTAEKKEVIVNLKPGSNIIVMHALNLGRIPPNTAAIGLNAGKKKVVTLVSDLKESGALEIIYEP